MNIFVNDNKTSLARIEHCALLFDEGQLKGDVFDIFRDGTVADVLCLTRLNDDNVVVDFNYKNNYFENAGDALIDTLHKEWDVKAIGPDYEELAELFHYVILMKHLIYFRLFLLNGCDNKYHFGIYGRAYPDYDEDAFEKDCFDGLFPDKMTYNDIYSCCKASYKALHSAVEKEFKAVPDSCVKGLFKKSVSLNRAMATLPFETYGVDGQTMEDAPTPQICGYLLRTATKLLGFELNGSHKFFITFNDFRDMTFSASDEQDADFLKRLVNYECTVDKEYYPF